MPGTNDFQPFAYAVGANVVTQAAYLALTSVLADGFAAGTAQSNQLNKVWRQSSLMSAVLAQFIVDETGANAVDDGTTATLLANLKSAVAIAAANAANVVAPGTIIDFSGTSAPAGYLTCPTSLTNVSRTTYAALFAAIGTTWGAGDGSTTFGIPWFPADYASVQANANVGTQTVGQVIAHTHSMLEIQLSGGSSAGVVPGQLSLGAYAPTTSTGGPANLAAGVRVLKCVKY